MSWKKYHVQYFLSFRLYKYVYLVWGEHRGVWASRHLGFTQQAADLHWAVAAGTQIIVQSRSLRNQQHTYKTRGENQLAPRLNLVD